MALYPLHRLNPIRRIVADTYQSVSGAGGGAITEMQQQWNDLLSGALASSDAFPHQIADNALPEIGSPREDGYTSEEWKMVEETRKIMHAPEIAISATCVRVPVSVCHSEAVHVEFTEPMSPEEARELLQSFPGVEVVDDLGGHRYPMPTMGAGRDEVFVGRIRRDGSHPRGLAMWIVSDNLRKGAALNAIQIAEELVEQDLFPVQQALVAQGPGGAGMSSAFRIILKALGAVARQWQRTGAGQARGYARVMLPRELGGMELGQQKKQGEGKREEGRKAAGGREMVTVGRLLTAMVTPFDEAGTVDVEQAKRLAQALVDSGSDGVVLAGTTGEAPTLSREEKLQLFSEVKGCLGDRACIVAGAGSYNTAESVELTRDAERQGVDAVMAVVPYYNKPPMEGLYRHFRAIAEATSLPVILYNVPSRTSLNMDAKTVARLSEIDNIIGIKEAGGDYEQAAQILEDSRPGFLVWSGNDSDNFGIMALGGYGAVSVASHLVGRQIRGVLEGVLEGRLAEAAAEHRRLLRLSKGLFVVANPIPVKWCLNEVGFRVGTPRLPLIEAEADAQAFLRELLSNYAVDLPVGVEQASGA